MKIEFEIDEGEVFETLEEVLDGADFWKDPNNSWVKQCEVQAEDTPQGRVIRRLVVRELLPQREGRTIPHHIGLQNLRKGFQAALDDRLCVQRPGWARNNAGLLLQYACFGRVLYPLVPQPASMVGINEVSPGLEQPAN